MGCFVKNGLLQETKITSIVDHGAEPENIGWQKMFELYEAMQQQQSLQDHMGTGDDWLRVFNAATDAGHDVEKANDLAGEFVLGSTGD